MRLLTMVLGLLVLATPCRAQDMTGAWRVRWAQAVRVNSDRSVTVQRWGEGALTLHALGDSLTGTWVPAFPGTTWYVRGAVRDGQLHLRADEHDSSDPELAIVESLYFQAEASETELEGEMWMVIRGRGREPARRPWSAVRPPPR